MDKARILYLKKNTIASVSFEFLTVICGFILPRFILQSFGSETNGLVSSITHFLGFISLCELGMGAVVPANLYRPLAEKNNQQISCVITSAQKFYRVIALILLAYIAVLTLVYPIIVQDSFSYAFSASLIVIISVSSFAQYYFGITYSLLLKADQKQYVSLIINSTTLVLNTVISVALIKLGFNIHIVKAASSLIFVCRPLFLNLYVRKHYKLNFSVRYEGEPIKQKWNGIAQHFASTIQEKADTVILTLLSTLSAVSIYGVYFMVINGIKGLIYSLTAGMSAMIGNMLAKDEIDGLKRVFSKFEWSMHTISTLLYTITGLAVVPFVQVYTKGLSDANIYVQPLFATILCIALAARCIQFPYNVVVQAAGHFKETQMSALIEPIINVLLSIILVYKFGLVGVAIGTLVSMIYRVLYLATYLMRNIIKTDPKQFTKQLIVDMLSTTIMILTTYWISLRSLTYYSWLVFVLEISIICVLVCTLLNFIFYRQYMLSIIHSFENLIKQKKC